MSIVWFRSDLRAHDNAALHAALASGSPVVGVFIAVPGQWRQHDHGPAKVDFLLRNVEALRASLASYGIPLIYREAEHYRDAVSTLAALATALRAHAVHVNDEYGVNERRRDRAAAAALANSGAEFFRYCDFVLQPPGAVRTGQGEYFKVFTPFKRAWLRAAPAVVPEYRVWAQALPELPVDAGDIPSGIADFEGGARMRELWPAGEQAALDRLRDFAAGGMGEYHRLRDQPAVDGTSSLSAYLAAGVISCRECFRVALALGGGWEPASAGAATWLNELIWREFYTHVLAGFPRVSKGRAFVEAAEGVRWLNRREDFEAWCQGRTGVPIVDAAIRQLLETGWMHNRLRMVAAQFLSKHLLVDWRWGERFFMQHLVDGELAANNGGWQWSASTGTDAAPYFRVFNPVEQSRRHDPDGSFIRRYLPELASLSARDIHLPRPEQARALGYPEPVVDLRAARQRAIEAFAEVLSRGARPG